MHFHFFKRRRLLKAINVLISFRFLDSVVFIFYTHERVRNQKKNIDVVKRTSENNRLWFFSWVFFFLLLFFGCCFFDNPNFQAIVKFLLLENVNFKVFLSEQYFCFIAVI